LKNINFFTFFLLSISLASCGGGGGGDASSTSPVTSCVAVGSATPGAGVVPVSCVTVNSPSNNSSTTVDTTHLCCVNYTYNAYTETYTSSLVHVGGAMSGGTTCPIKQATSSC